MPRLNINDLKKQTKVSDDQLGQECQKKHLKKITQDVENYPQFASKFDLPPDVKAEIDTDNKLLYGQKTEKVFLWWRKNSGNSTYLTFVQACLELGQGDIARKMCKMCKDQYSDVEPIAVLQNKYTYTIAQPTSESGSISPPVSQTLGLQQRSTVRDKISVPSDRNTEVKETTSKSASTSLPVRPVAFKIPVQHTQGSESATEGMQMFCTTEKEELEQVDSADPYKIPTNTQGAWVAPYHLLWDVKQLPDLKVHFLNPDILDNEHWKCGHAGPLTVDIILAWAAVWNSHADHYPKISNYVAKRKKAHIRVKFTSDKKVFSWSTVGRSALDVDKNEPTMMLNLFGMTKALQGSTVIHEFGHALGLYHEHQRSDFWDVLEPFTIGESRMKSGDGGRCEPAVNAVFRDKLNAPHWSQISSYDPDSIMHYWFDTKWLLLKYQNRSNVAKYVKDERERKVLFGVHDRDYSNGELAENPSKLDYETLNRAYEVISGQKVPLTTAAAGPQGTSQQTKPEGSSSDEYSSKQSNVIEIEKQSIVLTEADILTICEGLKTASNNWLILGLALGVKLYDLKNIESRYQDNRRCLMEMIIKLLEIADPKHPITWLYICECLRNIDRKDVANLLCG
ncbi:uncharacterized protein LOC135335465 isoform X4 [Halichondria panicea]|uniref:uncharacterized protein LOC135335465 isoform X4 n=1 Tax=Halichondria panicea TaxID=6063 RepID=UPI00312B2E4D